MSIYDDDEIEDGRGTAPELIIGRDPFDIIGDIPTGRVYQWVTLTVYGSEAAAWPSLSQFLKNGWNIVPPERHPEMPSSDGRIVYGGQVLLEASKEHAAAARRSEEEKARTLFQVGAREPLTAGSPIRAISPQIVANTEYYSQRLEQNAEHLKTRADAKYVLIDVTIGLVLTDIEIDTAAALGLDVREYARRKFLMRAHLLQRVNDEVYRDPRPGQEPIFSFMRLTLEDSP